MWSYWSSWTMRKAHMLTSQQTYMLYTGTTLLWVNAYWCYFFLHWHPHHFTLLNMWLLIGECGQSEFERLERVRWGEFKPQHYFILGLCMLSRFIESLVVKMSAISIIALLQNNKKREVVSNLKTTTRKATCTLRLSLPNIKKVSVLF